MAVDLGRPAKVRGGVVLPTRVYVDADGNPVPTGSTKAVRLYAPAGTVVSEAEASRLKVGEPPSEHECEVCGYAAKTSAGLGAHQRRHKDGR